MNMITNALNTSATVATTTVKIIASIVAWLVLLLLCISATPLIVMLGVTFVIYNVYRFFTYRTRITFREFILNGLTSLKDSIEKQN